MHLATNLHNQLINQSSALLILGLSSANVNGDMSK